MTWTAINPHPRVADLDLPTFDYSTYPFVDIKVNLRPDGIAIIVFAFELFDADDRVKVAIITGSGKVFCAGAYLAQGFGAFADHAQGHRDGGGQVALAILRCRKPSIAAINGNAIGIGVTMTLSCDFRLVAQEAKVAIPFVQRGIAMEACSSYLLPRLVLPESLKLAEKLAKNSSVSMALFKAQMWRQVHSPEDAHLLESQGIWETARLDGGEGANSFLEKRQARFQGKMKDLDKFAFWPWWRQADVNLYGRGPEALRAAKEKSKL
ncbi:related to enoyl-CoA hydratase [Ustilago bromivora]|uniref:Related to enoyl-CoA hydratase n=1 Tax=Ustilago bromivora TaxID=307758 RepID=A0A1K0G5Q0_9BASI|nr:related to enoyl-CoA hydratase [Ustilago bromivora]